MKSPILLIGFNRSDLFEKSLNRLTDRSRSYYISIDGPRSEIEETEVLRCRQLSLQFQSKFCDPDQVKLNFFEENLGCKRAVVAAIDWVFETNESAIILEDDIFFTDNFFKAMDLWLDKYKLNKDVFHLNGFTPLPKFKEVDFPYLSRYTHVWGWATWRDRWEKYDRSLGSWDPEKFQTFPVFENQSLPKEFYSYWEKQIQMCLDGLDTWDVQWLYSQWLSGGYSVTPGRRLTGNLGFDSRATHTSRSGNRFRESLPQNSKRELNLSSVPSLNHELNRIHDSIEHGIGDFPLKSRIRRLRIFDSFTAKFGWFFVKLSFAHLKMKRSVRPFQLFITRTLPKTINFFEFSKVFSFFRRVHLLVSNSMLVRFGHSTLRFIRKSILFIYWRCIYPTSRFIRKSILFIYWRGVR